jgi:hypothetical protein
MLKRRGSIDWPEFLVLMGLMVGVWFLWNSWAIYPLKILVVFFHELSHGLVAVATGGRIKEIQLSANEGGLCVTQGGSRFLTLSAGYLGSVMWGGMLLLLAARTAWDRGIALTLGVVALGVSLLWIRPAFGFGFNFAAGTGVVLMAAGVFLRAGVNEFLIKVIGLTSCLYAVMDIKSDILDRPGLKSDATMLAEATHVPAMVWGLVWMGVAAVAGLGFLAMATRKGKADGGGGVMKMPLAS